MAGIEATWGEFRDAAGRRLFPLFVEAPRQPSYSRLSTLFRFPLLLPLWFLGYVLALLQLAAAVVAWCVIVISGHYPRRLFGFVTTLLRWEAHYFAFYHLLTDSYPPLPFVRSLDYPVRIAVAYPEHSSRLLAIARPVTMIPGYFVFAAVSLTSTLLLPVSWLAILLTGRHPEWLFNFHEGTLRWYMRLAAYMYLLRDDCPPYSMRPDAPASSNVVAFIVGITIIAILVIAIYSMFSQIENAAQGHSTTLVNPDTFKDQFGRVYERGVLGIGPASSILGMPVFTSPASHGNPVAWFGDIPLFRE